ncbi:MAG: hypothetical protein KatS3mg032_0381 [Cyclobacteriaceae bacterium]|nr:MAG: hypothetical protein KatS3mg032_0381 [Cyclobacteriaceae bacterium]
MRYALAVMLFFFVAAMALGQPNDTTGITIIGVGDIMMGTTYPKAVLPPEDGRWLMYEVAEILRSADATIGNLEGVLMDEEGTPKTCRDPSVCYVFKSPVRYVKNLADAGFDAMSLANNHAGDFGADGRKSSMLALQSAGIAHAGQLEQKTTVFTRNGIRFGFVAFAPNSNCLPLNELEGAKKLVAALDSVTDIVIVSFHGGAEGPQHEHVPRATEYFHGENRGDVYAFAHAVIDAGADVVFGHGPHVVRAVEVYRNRFIAYSLGNFCTYGGINVSGINGLAPIIKVVTDRRGKFLRGQIISAYQVPRDRVKADPEHRAARRIAELTKKDFPDLPLHIDEYGNITYLAR